MAKLVPREMVQRLIETDHAGRVVYATPEAARLLGTTSREMTACDIVEFFPQYQRQLRTQLRSAADGHTAAPVDVSIRSAKDRRPIIISVRVARLDARRLQWRLVRANEAQP
jgi:PAS domain-containing protein